MILEKDARMKTIIFCLIAVLPLIIPVRIAAQYTLTIEIINLKNNDGQILMQLYDENQNKIKGAYGNIHNHKCIITFDKLKAQKYAFKYFHDDNNNNNLETNWLGIPKEGYGFSNNATGLFGPPAFEKWIFELHSDLKMVCTPKY